MTLRALVATLFVPVLLMACVEDVTGTPTTKPPVTTVPSPVDLSSCSSDSVQSLIGVNVNSVDTSRLAKTVRIIPPNTPVMLNYSPERLNIETNARDIIVRLSCG